MAVKVTRIIDKTEPQEIIDNISDEVINSNTQEIKEKQPITEKTEKRMNTEIGKNKPVSFKFGVIGCGHCGARLAAEHFKLGYDAIALNTATQDLVHIDIPEDNKLFLDIGIQGAAKDMSRGEQAAEMYREKIQELILDKLGSSEVIIVCSSTSGGSGAGALPVVIDILQTIGKPIVILAVLPMVSDDVRAKANAVETMAKLANYVREGKAHNLIIVDNARIESINAGVSQMEFFKVANKSIVETLHTINRYSMEPSPDKPLDSAEFATILLNGEGLSIYGQICVHDYEDELAISAAVENGLTENLLAEGFDFKQAKYVGFMAIANENVWKKVPAGAVNFASQMITDKFGNPESSYRGTYISDDPEDVVKVYTIVSGLSLPESRLDGLKKDVEAQQAIIKAKDVDRAKKLTVASQSNNAISDVEKIKQRLSNKMKGFGKLNSLVVDKRSK